MVTLHFRVVVQIIFDFIQGLATPVPPVTLLLILINFR
jgi:hypothetical protein